jgi:hypothetical protein
MAAFSTSEDSAELRHLLQIAPSGALPKESMARIVGRYTPNWLNLGRRVGGDTAFRQQASRLFMDPVARAKEAYRLGSDRVDYAAMLEDGYTPQALLFGGDTVFDPDMQQIYLESLGVKVHRFSDNTAPHSTPYLQPEKTAETVAELLGK